MKTTLFFLLFISATIFSQESKQQVLNIHLLNSEGEHVENAIVRADGVLATYNPKRKTYSATGIFEGDYLFTIECDGYEPFSKNRSEIPQARSTNVLINLKKADYLVNTIYYFDSKILKANGTSRVIEGNALVEIKNNSAKALPVPSFYVDAPKKLLLRPRNIEPGASLFYNVKWGAATSKSPPLLLHMALSKEEVEKIMKIKPPYFRIRGFNLRGFGNYETNLNSGRGLFKCPECLENYYQLPIDTLVNKKDTSLLKEKYNLYKVDNKFYVLYDTTHRNALLAEIYKNKWKPKLIPSKKIEVQNEKFYYEKLTKSFDDYYKYSDLQKDEKDRTIALFKITNHSKNLLYIKKNIKIPDDYGYKLSYYGEEREEKNRTMNALSPNGTLVVKLFVDSEKVQEGNIDLDLNSLFINCPETKLQINFTPDYFIES